MTLAIIGSRDLEIKDIEALVPVGYDTILSGGAKGIDTAARCFALKKGLRFIEILPDYRRFGRGAPLVRNKEIVERADAVLAIWNGCSRGTRFVIDYCKRLKKRCYVIIQNNTP